MTGDQLILLTVALTLVLPPLIFGAVEAFKRHNRCSTTTIVDYVVAYMMTLLSIVGLAVVLHLLPKMPEIWRSLG